MPFSTVFQLYLSGQCTYPCFPGVILTITAYNILSKPLAAFPHNHCQTTDSGESGKKTGRAGDRTSDIRFSRAQPNELWGPALLIQVRQTPIVHSVAGRAKN